MSKMGQELIKAMREIVDYSEGKIYLRTSTVSISPSPEKYGIVSRHAETQ